MDLPNVDVRFWLEADIIRHAKSPDRMDDESCLYHELVHTDLKQITVSRIDGYRRLFATRGHSVAV